MGLLNNIKMFLYALLATILLVKLIDLSLKALKAFKKYNSNLDSINNWENGIISVKDLATLSPKEFEIWCGIFLNKLGYNNIEITDDSNCGDGGKDIICFKDNEKFFVECKRYSTKKNAKFVVNTAIVKKFIGTMVGENVQSGIILTTGSITEDAKTYIESLPAPLNIHVYAGNQLILDKVPEIEINSPLEEN